MPEITGGRVFRPTFGQPRLPGDSRPPSPRLRRAASAVAPTERRGARPGRPEERGFTLMELLVAIAIIMILSSMLTGGVMVALRRGGITKTNALIARIGLALDQYESDWGDYPPGSGGASSAESLHRCLASPKWRGQAEFSQNELRDTDANGKLEITDHWAEPLSYYHHRGYSGAPRETTFRLVSKGPDGEEGTGDDITNF